MDKQSSLATNGEIKKPKLLKIFIKTNIHDQIEIEAKPTDSVGILKARVSRAKNFIRTQQFDLKFRDRLLNNDSSLIVDHKIKDGSVIDLKLRHISGGLVRVKRRDDGQVFTIEYRGTDKIKVIKEKISELFQIPVESQHLSASLLNLKKKSEYVSKLDDEALVFQMTNRCRKPVLLDVDKYSAKKN